MSRSHAADSGETTQLALWEPRRAAPSAASVVAGSRTPHCVNSRVSCWLCGSYR